MKKLAAILLFSTLLFSAQNQRFAYEYKFITDSTDLKSLKTEMMYLDVTKDGSKYYSREVFLSDSLQNAEFEKQVQSGSHNINIKSVDKGLVKYKISKKYPGFETIFNNHLGMDSYDVSDGRKMTWKILPDKEKVGEFMAQKATTNIYGRQWTAWFTDEIPIQDGPYKFSGLPGLIIKLSDASNSHVFELIAVTKFKGEIEDFSTFKDDKAIKINQNQYKKLFIDLRNDPAKTLKAMMASGSNIHLKTSSGQEMSMLEIIRHREKSAKENNLKNNNPLDLELLK